MGLYHMSRQPVPIYNRNADAAALMGQFVDRIRNQAASVPSFSNEELQQHLGIENPVRSEAEIATRRELSERAREVQAQQAFLSKYADSIPEKDAHLRAFYRFDIKDNVTSLMANAYLVGRPSEVVSATLRGLGKLPTQEQLLQMSDEDLVKDYPRILQLSQIADAAHKLVGDNRFKANEKALRELDSMRDVLMVTARRMDLIASPYYAQTDPEGLMRDPGSALRAQALRGNGNRFDALAEYCDDAAAIRQAQVNTIGRKLGQAMEEISGEGFTSTVIPVKTTFYKANGEMLRTNDGRPARADSPAVLSALMNGEAVVGMRAGRAVQVSVEAGDTPLLQLTTGDPTSTVAKNQAKNISGNEINALVEGITAGDTAMMRITGSRQYKNLRTQMENFRDTYGSVDANTLSQQQREDMMAALTALHAASQEYLNYKHAQRSGDLSGAGRRNEKTRIDAALAINDFAELAAAQLSSVDQWSKAAGKREAERRADMNRRSDYDMTLTSNRDLIYSTLLQHYSPLAGRSPSQAVRDLAKEISDDASELARWGTTVMTEEQKKSFKDQMVKMVAINLLNKELESVKRGIIDPPGGYAAAYQANKTAFLNEIADMLPKEADTMSVSMLVVKDHDKTLDQLALGVQKSRITRNVAQHYGQLAEKGATDTIRTLAGELRDNANNVSVYATASKRGVYEQGVHRALLSKMVLLDLLGKEKVGQEQGVITPPGKFELIYKQSPKQMLAMIETMIPEDVSANSVQILTDSGFNKKIARIGDGVQKSLTQLVKPSRDTEVVEKKTKMLDEDGKKPEIDTTSHTVSFKNIPGMGGI